jgi:hypothetical protein
VYMRLPIYYILQIYLARRLRVSFFAVGPAGAG